MKPGPTLIHQCPKCEFYFKRETMLSGNTIDAKFRSDGKISAPMLTITPPLVACPKCEQTLKTDELDIGIKDDHDSYLLNSPPFGRPKAKACLEYLANGKYPPGSEKILRRYTMQVVNDERLAASNDGLTAVENSNLNALLAILDDTIEYDILCKAEILRNMGNFEEAKSRLNYDFKRVVFAEQLCRKIELSDRRIFTLAGNEERYDLEYSWKIRRKNPKKIPTPFHEINPPIFRISNRDWYFKIKEDSKKEWALIEELNLNEYTVYFITAQSFDERPAITSSEEFSDLMDIYDALQDRGFNFSGQAAYPLTGDEPIGYFYDARNTPQ